MNIGQIVGVGYEPLVREYVAMLTKFRCFLSDETGATAIEYGLIAALVSVAAIVALQFMGNSLRLIFNVVATELNSAASSST